MQDSGWDPVQESREMLDDLRIIARYDFPQEHFKDLGKTRVRLALMSYAHLTEMDAPYHVIANLLRMKAHMPYVVHPFRHLARKPKSNKVGAIWALIPPSPKAKIKLIKELSARAGVAEISSVIDEFYYPEIRHAIDHSDYVLHDDEFRMLHGYVADPERKGVLTPVLSFGHLGDIIGKGFAFYSAFFALERQARLGFKDLKGKSFPYDLELKGLLEFLVGDDGELSGFKIHWPNALDSTYRRTAGGCEATNISINSDGSINFFVGEYHRNHHPMSSLVPSGGHLTYTATDGSTESLNWPDDAPMVYEIPMNGIESKE